MLKSLSKSCTLEAHLNGRVEKHGEDNVPAFDVRVTLSLTKAQLNKFTGNDQLWHSWFQETGDGEVPLLEHWHAYRWKPKFEDCNVVLSCGENLTKEEIELGACKLKGFRFIPQKGGQTEVSFSIGAIADEDNCRLLLHIGSDQVSIDVKFGGLVIQQQELKLESGEDDELDAGVKTPVVSDDDRPGVH